MTNLDFALAELDAGRHGSDIAEALRDARSAAARVASVVATNLGPARPAIRVASEAASEFEELEPSSGRLARVARVLVVDDEPAIGRALARGLRDYDVVVTMSGREALSHLSKGERFDFILCDMSMPEMSGDQVYEEIGRVAPEQVEAVVFITGGATSDRTRHFLATVPNPVVQKPFDVAKLRTLMGARLARP